MNTRPARTITAVLSGALILSLTACGTDGIAASNGTAPIASSTEPSPTTSEAFASSDVSWESAPQSITDATIDSATVSCPTPNSGSVTPGMTLPADAATTTPLHDDSVPGTDSWDLPAHVTIGPFGYGEVELGDDPAAAAASGIFADTPTPGNDCVWWNPVPSDSTWIASVLVSPTLGVVRIQPRRDVPISTPELMRVGWTAEQVAAAYPSFAPADAADGVAEIVVPDNATAHYTLQFDKGLVSYFELELSDENCSL